METNFYLIRHGQSSWNSDTDADRFNGITDVTLSERGMIQAKLLAEHFSEIDIDKVFSTPLQRSYNTALPIARKKHINPIIVPELIEINFGDWEGLTMQEIKNRYSHDFSAWVADPAANYPTRGESGYQVAARVMPWIADIASGKFSRNLILVAHKVINRIILCHLMGISVSQYRNLIPQRVGCINHIIFRQGKVDTIQMIDDISYIHGAL